MSESMLVSIIMPAYNAEKYIREAILSVLAQTYSFWELIVVDDGSTDRTPLFVKELQLNDGRIIYYYQKNGGLGAARNAGFKIAKGKWICLLDSDDLWCQNKLELQMLAAQQYQPDLIFSQGSYLYEQTGELKPYDSLTGIYQGDDLYAKLIRHNYIPALSVCFKKELISKIGYQSTLPIERGCEDWDYWLRICRANYIFLGLEARLFKYRIHPAAMSANKMMMRQASLSVIVKNFQVKLLNQTDRDVIRYQLFLALPFICRQIFKGGRVQLVACRIKTMVRILTITGSSLPAFLIRKFGLFKSAIA